MAIAVVLVLLVVGSVIFHFMSPWWFTPIASNWTTMDDTVILTFWVTGIVFVVVNLFLAWVVIRYRHRKGQKADYEPENKKLEWWLTIVTSIGVAAMLAPGPVRLGQVRRVPKDAAIVEAVGQQWHWSFRFPGEDGELGHERRVADHAGESVRPRSRGSEGPGRRAGREPGAAPAGRTSRSRCCCARRTCCTTSRSRSSGSRWTSSPGMITYLWLTPTVPGEYEILCEELCGVGAFRDAWTRRRRRRARNSTPGSPRSRPSPRRRRSPPPTRSRARRSTRSAWPATAPSGEGNPALNAPRLAGQQAWYLRRQLHAFRNGLRGVHEHDTYGAQMRAFASMLPDDTAIRNLAAYVETLPGAASAGDRHRRRGARPARSTRPAPPATAAKAEGIWALNAPRLADMSDWYLVRQLQNFQQRHPRRASRRTTTAGRWRRWRIRWPTSAPSTTSSPTSIR